MGTKLQLTMIKIKSYNLKNILLTNEILNAYINNFWKDIYTPLLKEGEKHLMLMCKVQFTDESMGYRTLGHLRKVNFTELELFLSYLTERLGLLNDAYTTLPISKLTFSYIIKEGLATDTDRRLLQDLTDKTVSVHRFNKLNLPVSMLPSDYGILLSKSVIGSITRYITTLNKKVFQIDVSLDGLTNKVTVLGASDLNWVDTKLVEGFKREIAKTTLYFVDGELLLRKQLLPAKAFKKLSVDSNLKTSFTTMDIETINQEGKLIPYLICAYNGKDYVTSYALDQKTLFTSFLEQLLSFFNKNSNNLMVYAHNLSGFDGIFLMKHLLSYGTVEPLLFNGRLMSISIKLNNKLSNGEYYGKTIIFKDSYLLLPLSLRLLCKAFSVIVPKGYFPFKITNIFYSGILPEFAQWTGISLTTYDSLISEYAGKIWDFQNEAIKYCKLDCKCLHEVLTKFNELIFKEFKVNMTKSLTLPALAMRIFKTHFMTENSIFQLLGKIESDIRESYTGGAVDVYIPHN
jgi:hypothetical protein